MRYFCFNEFFASDVADACGIKNRPSLDELLRVRANIMLLVYHALDPIRVHVGKPVRITSGYRCARLNEIVGGHERSQHLTGEAADFQIDSFSLKDYRSLAYWCADCINFDQLIVYSKRKFMHISYASPQDNRNEVLFT